MRILTSTLLAVLSVFPLQADPVGDLQAFLRKHPGQSLIHLRVAGDFRQVEERKAMPATSLPTIPVNLRLTDGPSGFQISWAPGYLAEAAERNPPEDLGLTLPNLAHASTEWLDPICLARAANPVRTLQRLLEVAKFKTLKAEPWNGRPAQAMTLSFESPVPERYRRFANTTEGSITVWIGPDSTPYASEITLRYRGKMGRISGEFSRLTIQKATYGVTSDRIFTASLLIEDRTTLEWDITRTVLTLKAEQEP